MKLIFFITLFFFSLTSHAVSNDPTVATVNGRDIKKSVLLSYHKQNLNFIQNKKVITLENSLNDLIDRIIGIGSAKKSNIHTRPDVVKKVNDVIYHAYISDQLSPLLKKINVTKRDIKNYYSKFPEYKTSQILLRLRTLPSEDDVARVLRLANQLYAEAIKAPKNFIKLAQQHGQTTTAPTGGNMGFQPKVRLGKKYFESINGKSPGYITKPFRSQYGMHIVLVEDVKKYKQIDHDLYKKIVYDVKRDNILAKYFKKMRKKAKIKINRNELKNE